MSKLLILGGCHVTSVTFCRELKKSFEYRSIRTITTHFHDDNFDKALKILENNYQRRLFDSYNILIQLDNLHYKNSITNIFPNFLRKSINKFVSKKFSIIILSQEENSANTGQSFFYSGVIRNITYKSIRFLFQIVVFPVNLLYIPIKGTYVFYRIRKIITRHYKGNRIIIFTTIKSLSRINNLFKLIGSLTIKIFFSNLDNIFIFDSHGINFDFKHYKDENHLNDKGVIFMANSLYKQTHKIYSE
jgi:hypothetical protein